MNSAVFLDIVAVSNFAQDQNYLCHAASPRRLNLCITNDPCSFSQTQNSPGFFTFPISPQSPSIPSWTCQCPPMAALGPKPGTRMSSQPWAASFQPSSPMSIIKAYIRIGLGLERKRAKPCQKILVHVHIYIYIYIQLVVPIPLRQVDGFT